MSMRDFCGASGAIFLRLLVMVACPFAGAFAAGPHLGRELSSEQLAALPATIYPDGAGLPAGSGTVSQGESIYRAQCASCHGPEGRGGTADELAGGAMPLDSEWPDKNIGTYWPYATTLFDFIRRSMPMRAPGSLSNDDVYAVSAYLLHLNGIVGADIVMDARRLAQIKMPNRDGFIWIGVPHGEP